MDIKKALDLDFETPFMIVDLDQVNENINKMQALANKGGKKLRPHSKTHKIPEISRLQIERGATGVCVQKISEGEIMFRGGVSNILLSNEILGSKNDRAAKLISQGADLTVAIDNYTSALQLSEALGFWGKEANVLVDVNIGMNRCGVNPENFTALVEKVSSLPRITIQGIMAYDGHVNYEDPFKRRDAVLREEKILFPLIGFLRKKGMSEPIVSVGGTPTAEDWSKSDVATEIQPGTYVYYDTHCLKMGLCSLNEIAIGVVATVISETPGERFVLDAGYKSVSLDQGVFPLVLDSDGTSFEVVSMSEEHTVLRSKKTTSYLGKKFVMLPYHACTTTDLWDSAYGIGKGMNPRLMIIEARGKRE
ncbi:MAG: alanine racemase [Candidatus Micrarchaeaceae archaeon]